MKSLLRKIQGKLYGICLVVKFLSRTEITTGMCCIEKKQTNKQSGKKMRSQNSIVAKTLARVKDFID